MAALLTRKLVLTAILFSISLLLLILPFVIHTKAATSGTFNVTLTINNVPPFVSWVNGSVSGDPTEGTFTVILVSFNVTDNNSAADLNDSTAAIILNLSTETSRSSSVCWNTSEVGNTVTYSCNITLWYWDMDGSWTINASIQDNSGQYAQNVSQTFTWNLLRAMTVTKPALSFTGIPSQENISAAENPQVINNTGNRNFTMVNMTGYELRGVTYNTYVIAAGNLSVNISNSSLGQPMVNGSTLQVTGSTLPRGNQSTEDLYLYLDIPTGMRGQQYQAAAAYVIGVAES